MRIGGSSTNRPGQEDSDDQNSLATNLFKTFVNLAGTESRDTLQLAKVLQCDMFGCQNIAAEQILK
jgi:hypothetical protein